MRTESDIKDFDDLLKRAKANPGITHFLQPGVGSTSQLGMELLSMRAGIDVTHVPYDGAGSGAGAVCSAARRSSPR